MLAEDSPFLAPAGNEIDYAKRNFENWRTDKPKSEEEISRSKCGQKETDLDRKCEGPFTAIHQECGTKEHRSDGSRITRESKCSWHQAAQPKNPLGQSTEKPESEQGTIWKKPVKGRLCSKFYLPAWGDDLNQ